MTYTGDVRVGGPSDTREIGGGLTVTKLAVGDMNNNAYLLRDASGQGLLIDAAAEPDRLIELIGDTPVAKIVTTHQHGDHWQALAAVKAATRATTVAHPADAPGIPVETDELVEDGGTVAFGDTSLSVIHLVGHTPGSIALVIDADGPAPHIFTGDCLFPGGVGNTQKDAARFASLLDGVETKVFDRLPDATWVFPGHGGDTTLGAERPHLAEWRARGWLAIGSGFEPLPSTYRRFGEVLCAVGKITGYRLAAPTPDGMRDSNPAVRARRQPSAPWPRPCNAVFRMLVVDAAKTFS